MVRLSAARRKASITSEDSRMEIDAVFLAKELGAASIKLVGFDYEDDSVTPRKRRKLAWAKRLIELALR